MYAARLIDVAFHQATYRACTAVAFIALSGGAFAQVDPTALPPTTESATIEEVAAAQEADIKLSAVTEPTTIYEWYDDSGSYLKWEYEEGEEGSISVVIGYPITAESREPPKVILDLESIEKLSPLLVYFLVERDATTLPEPLQEFATDYERAVISDEQLLRSLREQHDEHLEIENRRVSEELRQGSIEEQRPTKNFAFLSPIQAANAQPAPTCSVGQRQTARALYGTGYTNTFSCGEHNSFSTRDWSTFYCNLSPSISNCRYQIPVHQCLPSANNCSAFEGKLRVTSSRHLWGQGFNYSHRIPGHRYRDAVMNCSGSAVQMFRKRGSGAWIQTNVGPGEMQIRVGGALILLDNANPTLAISYGIWKQLVQQIGPTYQMNELLVPTNPGQPIAVCSDVQQRFETFDITHISCNHSQFCAPNQSCNGNCWRN